MRGLPSSGNKDDLIDRLLGKPAEALNTTPAVNTTDGERIEKLNTFKQRKANQRTLRSSTVKCMLKCRLREPEVMLPLIDALVFYVTQASRAGSLAFNSVLLHALTSALLPLNDFSHFNLPDWFEVDSPKWLEKLVRQCYLGPSEGGGAVLRGALRSRRQHDSNQPHVSGRAGGIGPKHHLRVTGLRRGVREPTSATASRPSAFACAATCRASG